MLVDLGSLRLGCADEGGGSCVLFLHGLAGDRDTFARQVPALVDRYRCLRPDLRGHGASSTPPGRWTIADFARDALGLLDALSIERAHLVGHSAGGVFATRFALDHPDRTTSLFLVGTSAEVKAEIAQRTYLRWAETAEEEGLAPALAQMGMRPPAASAGSQAASGFAKTCRAIAALVERPLAPELARIQCPTAYLVGERDPFGVAGSVKASRAVPGAELIVLPGLGHTPFRENVESFDSELVGFLEKVV